ncbi:TOM1-like protein 2 [Ceratobasidium sp. AG-Ba]|nr:TOM1-like protein 2 [Ceratobasidium sp. AG-Ba]
MGARHRLCSRVSKANHGCGLLCLTFIMTPEDNRHQNPPTKHYTDPTRATARESWIVVSPGNTVSEVHRPSLDNSNSSIRLVNRPPPPLIAQQSDEFRTPLVHPAPEFASRMSSTGTIPHGASPPIVMTPSNPNYSLPSSAASDGTGVTRDRPQEPPSILVPTTPREAIGHLDTSPPHANHDREREVLRRKNRGSGMLVGMFTNPNHDQRASMDDHESINSVHIQEKVPEKERHGFRAFFGTSREKEKEREREKEREKIYSRPNDTSDRGTWDITRLIGWTTSTNVEDWAVVMDICDKANNHDSDAKEAAKALRKDIQFGRPPAQLAAARLWAIMMRNCALYFVGHTTSRKFLGKIEEIALSPTTSPVIRDRLIEPYQATWKKLRAQLKLTLPVDGIELKADDPILNPTPYRPPSSMRHHSMNEHSQIDLNGSVTAISQGMAEVVVDPARERNNTKEEDRERRREKSRRKNDMMAGVISLEEDMRRLFEECEISRDNCKILAEALVYATPEILPSDPLIQEFRQKCLKSQEIVAAQIDWATAQADRARAQQLSLVGPGEHVPTTAEEQLLDALCNANMELNDVFKTYDDIERIGISEREEAEVRERSRVEVRLDRSKVQQFEGDVFVTAPEAGGASRSRSNTPVLGRRPLPQPAPPIQAAPPSPHVNSLAPPPPAPHGPRPLRNTTPSPIHGLDTHEQVTDLSSQEDESPPHFPSEKAMGKRKAEPQPDEEDEWPDHTSLLPLDDDTDENAKPKTPEVFMYDAAALKKELALKGH